MEFYHELCYNATVMRIFNNNNRIPILLIFLFILVGIDDAVNPGIGINSLVAPFLLALISFLFGTYKLKIRNWVNLVLVLSNVVFLIFSFHTGFLLLNTFLLSFLVWNLIAPYLVKYKAALPAAVITAVFLSFLIPYYKLNIPLLPFLYFPVFLFGYMLDSLKIRTDRVTIAYCLSGVFLSTVMLVNTFLWSLKLKPQSEMGFLQGLLDDRTAFAYGPVIVICFLLLVFCALILSIHRFDFMKFTNSGFVRHMNSNQAPQVSVNMSRLLFQVLFPAYFAAGAVLSVEFVLRGGNLTLLCKYVSTPSFSFNLLFAGILYLFITSVLGRKTGTILALLLHFCLLIINFLKLVFFHEPFFPWDFSLAWEAGTIPGESTGICAFIITAAVLLTAYVFIARRFGRSIRFPKPKPDVRMAAVMILPLVFSMSLIGTNGLKRINIYKGWNDGINEYERNGALVESTLYLEHVGDYLIPRPKGYNEQAMKRLGEKLGTAETAGTAGAAEMAGAAGTSETAGTAGASDNVKPDIIVALAESFWNPDNLNGVSFNREIASNLKRYQSGTLVSPTFGGGTANVEFEVLTGFSNFFFNQGIIPYNVYFKRSTPSIVSAFRDNGYDTVAIHPNDREFYNRANVYRYLGFDRFEDIKSFDPGSQKKGNYISDDNLVNKIETVLKEKSGPVFIQAITMQNHDPYTKGKNYGAGREIQAESNMLNADEKEILSNFAQGVYDEDKALGRLIELAGKNDRPTIVCFYGDHLPRLGVGLPQKNYEIYSKIGFEDGRTDPRAETKFYETPYVLWSNYKVLPGLNTLISPSQLSVELLKASTIRYPAYFNYLPELRKTLPYLSNRLESRSIANSKSVQNYYKIQYDILYGRRYLLEK